MLFEHVSGGLGVRMEVGCPSPPVRNDIVTLCNLYINKIFGLKILKIQKYPKIIKRLYFKLKKITIQTYIKIKKNFKSNQFVYMLFFFSIQ